MADLHVYTVATEEYELFIPTFLWSTLKFNPKARCTVGVQDSRSIWKKFGRVLELIQARLGHRLDIYDANFSLTPVPNSVRFLDFPDFEAPYVYFSDIDFLVCEDILAQHKGILATTGLPFNNVVRPKSQRLTGLHFTKREALWQPLSSNAGLSTELLHGNDERLLHHLVSEKLELDLQTIKGTTRPLPGFHLSLYSRFPLTPINPVTGADWVGWGPDNPKDLLSILDKDDALEFGSALPGASRLPLAAARMWALARLAAVEENLNPHLMSFLTGRLKTQKEAAEKIQDLTEGREDAAEKIQDLTEGREDIAARFQILNSVVNRPIVNAGLYLVGLLDWLRGRKSLAPLTKIRKTLDHPAFPDGIPGSHDSYAAVTVAVDASKKPSASHALNAMVSRRWAEASQLWSAPISESIVGENRQLWHAGQATTQWILSPESLPKNNYGHRDDHVPSGEKTIIFSAITGSHDLSWPAGEMIESADYFRFTDDLLLPTWQTWQNLDLEFRADTPARSARWIKTHPHMLLPDCRWAIWLDSNIIPIRGIQELLDDFQLSGKPLAAIPHPLRTGVEQEIAACIRREKDSPRTIAIQKERLGPDPLVGLWETGVMMFDLHHPLVKTLLNTWWSHIESGSHRDQISFPYAVSSTGANVHPLLPAGHSVRSDPRFALIPHKSKAFQAAHTKLRRMTGQTESAARSLRGVQR